MFVQYIYMNNIKIKKIKGETQEEYTLLLTLFSIIKKKKDHKNNISTLDNFSKSVKKCIPYIVEIAVKNKWDERLHDTLDILKKEKKEYIKNKGDDILSCIIIEGLEFTQKNIMKMLKNKNVNPKDCLIMARCIEIIQNVWHKQNALLLILENNITDLENEIEIHPIHQKFILDNYSAED